MAQSQRKPADDMYEAYDRVTKELRNGAMT